jgi:hypothetical protein
MRRPIRYVTLLVLPVLAVGTGAQNSPPGGQPMATPLSIEKKASSATADDPNSIRALVDEVFNLPHVFPRMPSVIESNIKDRLVRGEISYRGGKTKGVQEQDVVNAMNDLSDKLGGPPHSKTSLSQVRVLRMWMALSQPTFMGAGVARPDAAVGQSINTAMGPVQAAHLIATLIDQHFINPDFQVTPQEWAQNAPDVAQKIQARMAALRSGQPTTTVTARSYSPDKRRELEQTLYPSISALSATDGVNLIEQTLAKLQIN